MSFWDWVPALITTGATIWGAKKAADATQQAANTAATAQTGATAAEQAGIKTATGTQKQLMTQASPGLVGIQRVIGAADTLTPAQLTALEDSRRTTLDALRGGSLRGSARATSATVRDVDGRMTEGFLDANRQRADQAASNLSGQYFNAGNNIANLNLQTGKTASAGLINTGDINAANAIGQGNISGTAIGDIGAVIADQLKQDNAKKRDSSYAAITGGA